MGMSEQEFEFDLMVIGAGSGGVRAARIAAGMGRRVGICESDTVGGTCVIRGCVPKKLLVYAANYRKLFKAAPAFGWDVQARFDWPTLLANKNREIERLNGVYLRLLRDAGVQLINGHGSLEGPNHVRIDGHVYSAEHILIATGGTPWKPDLPGAEFAITSNEALDLAQLPASICVYGGGYIAVEFACIFNLLGSEVHLVYHNDPLLRGFDDSVRAFAQDAFKAQGIHVHTGCEIERLERAGDRLQVVMNGASLEVEQVLFATGRRANTESLNLASAGVPTHADGRIQVDRAGWTGVQGIYAVGDVCNAHNLTPVAIKEGHLLVNRLFASAQLLPEYDHIPTTVFSHPEIATVGLTEAEARERHTHVKVYTSTFRAMKYAMSEVQDQTFMKLIVAGADERVVGCHLVGSDAGEIIQGFAVAIKQGLDKARLDACIGIHPTSAEELVTMR